MFTSVSAFLQLWEKESELTQQILDVLTDGSLIQSVTQEDRTIGRLVWHIVTTIPEMMSKTGLIIDSIGENAPIPNSAKEIAASYHEISNEMVIAIRTQWDDQTHLVTSAPHATSHPPLTYQPQIPIKPKHVSQTHRTSFNPAGCDVVVDSDLFCHE